MTTREEWMSGAHTYMRCNARSHMLTLYSYYTPDASRWLPSFPSRSTRTVMVGDVAVQTDNTRLGLVSPLISSSLEVMCVVYWLAIRMDNRLEGKRSMATRRAETIMTRAGFSAPFTQCVPSERTITAMSAMMEAYVSTAGEYPAEYVELRPERTQGTRQRKVYCGNNHDDGLGQYIVRMSASQYERGAPDCGVCGNMMEME